VKTCASRECAELSSLFSSFDGDCQSGSFLIQCNQDKLSTLKFGMAKFFLGRGAETEIHIHEALRLSPRDVFAYRWFGVVGLAKRQLDADAEAVVWLRRSLDTNRNYSVAHFELPTALARLEEMDEARAAVQAGLALDTNFTIRRFRDATNARSDNPTFLAGRDRTIEGMRLAGVPEG
jgi:hypothetical protein